MISFLKDPWSIKGPKKIPSSNLKLLFGFGSVRDCNDAKDRVACLGLFPVIEPKTASNFESGAYFWLNIEKNFKFKNIL
jgi:hypothetical protein